MSVLARTCLTRAPRRLTPCLIVRIVVLSAAIGSLWLLLDRDDADADPLNVTVYVADTGANRVRLLDGLGVTSQNDPISGAAGWLLNRPEAIAMAPDGTLYVADTENDLIRAIDPFGTLIASWGGRGTEPGYVRGARGIAVGPDNAIVVAESINNRLQRFTRDGELIDYWGERGDGPGQFRSPQAIAVDDDGNIYVADHLNNRIQKFDWSGRFLLTIGDTGDPATALFHPEAVTVGPDGLIYVTDWRHRVARFGPDGGYLGDWGRFGDGAGEFKYPAGLAVDACSAIWVADWGNHRIQRFDAEGNHLTTWGQADWWSGEFLYPSAIAVVTTAAGCAVPAGHVEGSLAVIEQAEVPDGAVFSTSPPAGVGPDGHYDEVQLAADGTRYLIPLAEIQSGGVGRDGIPAINQPRFADSDEWEALDYRPDDLVVGIEVDGFRRAYPFQILEWHEVVNDVVAGRPIVVTYCPLCGSAIAFERVINGQAVEFGVSGQLYNSDLLMYDRLTDTLWSQLTGAAVVGELTGSRLELVPVEIMSWTAWQQAYPDSEVLSRNTGYGYPYDTRLYGDYANEDRLLFPVAERDRRLPVKERVTGVELPGHVYGAYADADVIKLGVVNDVVGDTPLLVVGNPEAGGNVVVFDRRLAGRTMTFELNSGWLVDRETGSRWDFQGKALEGPLTGEHLLPVTTVKSFWFAWYAFHPETALWLP